MIGDDLYPGEGMAMHNLTKDLAAAMGVDIETLDEEQLQAVSAVIVTIQFDAASSLARRLAASEARRRAARTEVDSLGYILREKRAAMAQLLRDAASARDMASRIRYEMSERDRELDDLRRRLADLEADLNPGVADDGLVARLRARVSSLRASLSPKSN